MPPNSPLLDWARTLRAIARTGLTFADGAFDRQRYEEVQRVAAEMAAYPEDPEPVHEVFAGYRGYATPLLICRAAVFDETDRVLLVRETADGLWALPGGWIDVGESPADSVEREVTEESGYRVSTVKLAAVVDKLRHEHPPAPDHAYILFFLCDLLGGRAEASVETSEVGWFEVDHLPALSTGRVTERQIRRMGDHHRDRTIPTDFD